MRSRAAGRPDDWANGQLGDAGTEETMNRASQFLAELFRRKVVRLLCAYVALFWLLSQGFASLFPVLGVPEFYLRAFIVTGAAAIPLLALISWKYNLIPPTLVRDTHDVQDANPTLSWAKERHDGRNAGHLLLNWVSDDGEEMDKRFFAPVTIGRESDNTIKLTDQFVSRYHVVMWAEGGQWRVRDLDSTNGTWLDDRRITGIATLPPGCRLQFHPKGPTIQVQVESIEATAVSTEV